jgi:hypothetical protein
LLALLSGCHRDHQVTEPGAEARAGAPLPFSLMTYESPAKVRQAIGASEFRVLREDRRAPFDSCPRLDRLEASLGEREHLGRRGEVTVEFINERLAIVRFFPKDFQGYFAALRASGVEPDEEGRFALSRELDGWVATHDDGREHVGWQDRRLYEEEFAWILACS